jgi:hypothetical protein
VSCYRSIHCSVELSSTGVKGPNLQLLKTVCDTIGYAVVFLRRAPSVCTCNYTARVFCYESFHKFLSLHVQHRLDDRLQIRLNNATTPCPCTEGLGSLRRFRRSSTGHAIFCCRFLGAKYSTGKWARAELNSGKFWHSQDFGCHNTVATGFFRASGIGQGIRPIHGRPRFFSCMESTISLHEKIHKFWAMHSCVMHRC